MKKLLFFAIIAAAILTGCKKNSKTEPISDTQPENPKVDTLFAEVYLKIYTSPLIYEYNDIVFYRYDENGDTVRLASAERSTPMDTLGVDSAFYVQYRRTKIGREAKGKYMLPIDSVKIFQTTEKVKVNNVGFTDCRIVAVRNSKELDLNCDSIYNNMLLANEMVPVDNQLSHDDFIGGTLRYAYLYGINFGNDMDTAIARYEISVKNLYRVAGKWSIMYLR